eukprot:gene18359-biopygen18947
MNLKHAARGFWPDEQRHLHITHLELEAVYKTVQSFLRELTGKVDGRQAVEHAPQTELAVGCKVKVYWPQDDAWNTGTVGVTGPDGLSHIAYEDGDKEDLDMSKEKYEVLPAAVREVAGWDATLQERWRGELGDNSLTELAVHMQGAALGDKTVGNYRPKARAFMAFCEAEIREWLPATGATVRLYIAHMLDKGKVQASNMQPYLAAINNYQEHMGFPGLAKGRAVSRAVKGMSRLQVQAAEAAREEQTVRTWLPSRHVLAGYEHGLGLESVGRTTTEPLRACTYVMFAFVTFGWPETGVSMRREDINITSDDIPVVLHKEKGRGHVRLRRGLTIPAAGVAGLVRLLQHLQQMRDAS